MQREIPSGLRGDLHKSVAEIWAISLQDENTEAYHIVNIIGLKEQRYQRSSARERRS